MLRDEDDLAPEGELGGLEVVASEVVTAIIVVVGGEDVVVDTVVDDVVDVDWR